MSTKTFWQNIGYVNPVKMRVETLGFGGRSLFEGSGTIILQCQDRQVFQIFTLVPEERWMLSMTNSSRMLRDHLRGLSLSDSVVRRVLERARS